VNVYSFALQPEQHQPSGTCNLSRIDNTTLLLTVSNNAVGSNLSSTVYVYATNYNVLRIMSGMGGKLMSVLQYLINTWVQIVSTMLCHQLSQLNLGQVYISA
jgi:hypothetical protein